MNIVMYHYVRPPLKEFPYFNSLSVETFKKQLDFFEKKFGFISQEDFLQSISSKKNIKGAVLTFDDGFQDHYEFVAPELKRRGLWGIFYISTGVYTSNKKKLLGVHRVHHLKGKFGAALILKDALKLLDEKHLDRSKIAEFDKEIYQHQNGITKEEKLLKRMFNYYISYEFRDIILDSLMDKYFDESDLFRKVYLSEREILSIAEAGNLIGSHTVNHPVLSRLSYIDQKNEIANSFDFIESLVGKTPRCFCYPYGYSSSYNLDTLSILHQLNVHNAVIFDNMEQTDGIKPLELSRIDCNQFLSF